MFKQMNTFYNKTSNNNNYKNNTIKSIKVRLCVYNFEIFLSVCAKFSNDFLFDKICNFVVLILC